MSPWQILEIPPNADQKTIKRAYAAKLKAIIPDEQPEEFQRLKSAFDTALKRSKNQRPLETIAQTEPSTPNDYAAKGSQPIAAFSGQLDQVLAEENFFSDLAVWKTLTAAIDQWSIDDYMYNTYRIQLFLVESYPYVSKEIIHFLFQLFELNQLDDHIGQERFVSTDFLYLKKKIYQVPPFSFDIAIDIPQDQRKDYFHLRYDLYQTIVSKQYDLVEINAKVNACAAIFADDSELWNLHLFALLDESNGLLDTNESKSLAHSLIAKINQLNDNPTSTFLTNYVALLDGGPTTDTLFDWHKEQLTISEELFILLLGSIFFHTNQYIPAFNLWKQLDLSRKIALYEHFKLIAPHLSKYEKKEYRLIEKEVRKSKKKKYPVLIACLKFFSLPVALGILMLLTYESPATRRPDPLEQYAEQSALVEELIAEEPKLYEGSIEEQFVHYFYTSDDPEGKQLFIDTKLIDAQLKELLEPYIHQNTLAYDDRSSFHFKENTVSDPDSQKIAVYYGTDLLCILESTSYKYTLTNVYGPQWNQLSETEFQQLEQSILINPGTSAIIFLKKFLFSNNKQENLLEYTDYLSENMKIFLETKLNEPVSENLKKGFLFLVRQPNVKLIVSDQNTEDEEKLILTFDAQGRLDHVFGPNWEEVDEEMIHYSNREAFKNIPTLLEEPD